ncbi:response regulator transcription factor [Niallia sp.]|uniref:response regulator transcription factor n=1 Tax=Niallia sp. TaxID=2837523 RepID=UPI00289DFC60|nr:response regulator transcription factor [Niallia sp.]
MKKVVIFDQKESAENWDLFFKNDHFYYIKRTSEAEVLNCIINNKYHLLFISASSKNEFNWTFLNKICNVSTIPTILVFTTGQKDTIVKALRNGADACFINPIDKEILLAKVNALITRCNETLEKVQLNGLTWSDRSFDIKFLDQSIKLAPKEYMILGYFLNHPNRVITHKELILALWGNSRAIHSRTVHSYVRNIRDKLRDHHFPIDQHLLTVWSVGYRWDNL